MALWRRDLRFAALLALLGSVALTTAMAQDRFRDLWVFEPLRPEATFYTSWIAGLVLGLCVALRDRVLGVRDHVRHRPMSVAMLHTGRLATMLTVLVAWWIVAPMGAWLCEAIDGDLVRVGRLANFGDVFRYMAPAASGAAIAVLGASLPFAWWAQALIAGGLLFLGFPACDEFAQSGGVVNLTTFALAHFAFATGLLALSYPVAVVERDADRPFTHRLPRWGTVGAFGLFALAFCLPLALAGRWTARLLAETYPAIAHVGDRYALVKWGKGTVSGPRRAVVVDEAHRPTDQEFDGSAIGAFTRPERFLPVDPEIAPPYHGSYSWHDIRTDRNGLANCIVRQHFDWSPQFFVFGRGDRSTPFHSGVRFFSLGTDGHVSRSFTTRQSAVWAVEPEATELFRFDPATGEVRAVPVPDGDRVVEVIEQERGDPPVLEGFRAPSALVRGEKGWYAFGAEALVPATAGAVEVETARRAGREARERRSEVAVVEDAVVDVLTPTLRMVRADGSTEFEHAYAPHTATETFAFALAVLPSMLRPPVLQATAHAFAASDSRAFTAFVDPNVAGGRRTWLVLASVVASVLLALVTRRRLRRFGADARTERFWFVAVAATGLPGALLAEWFEPSRAWRQIETGPTPAPRIRTVDAA